MYSVQPEQGKTQEHVHPLSAGLADPFVYSRGVPLRSPLERSGGTLDSPITHATSATFDTTDTTDTIVIKRGYKTNDIKSYPIRIVPSYPIFSASVCSLDTSISL